MEIKYGSDEAKQFVTNLGLVTSNGKWGHNIMTAEWVHHISYSPAMVMVNVHDYDATADNIMESGEFGISLASEGQAEMAKIAGNSSGKSIDKIAALEELGFGFHAASRIGVRMVSDAALSLECKLIKHEKVGDHMMFIGEVVSANAMNGEGPAIFRSGAGVYKVGERVEHGEMQLDDGTVRDALERHRRQAQPA